MKIGNRIKELRMFKNLGFAEFAAIGGVSERSQRMYEGNKTPPTSEYCAAIAEKFKDLDMNWLLTGEGTMLKGGGAANDGLSEEKQEWLRMLDMLDDDAKKAAFATTKTLAKNCEMAREFARFRQEVSQQRMVVAA